MKATGFLAGVSVGVGLLTALLVLAGAPVRGQAATAPGMVNTPLMSLTVPLNFGRVSRRGPLPKDQAVLITNAGGAPLTGTVRGFTDPDFSLVWPAGLKGGTVHAFSLGTWQNLPIIVRFRGHALGARAVAFVVQTNDGTGNHVVWLKAATVP